MHPRAGVQRSRGPETIDHGSTQRQLPPASIERRPDLALRNLYTRAGELTTQRSASRRRNRPVPLEAGPARGGSYRCSEQEGNSCESA
eukprot:scaffold912_cov422-Prasinococcus_capsulatus_cf.AAC.22